MRHRTEARGMTGFTKLLSPPFVLRRLCGRAEENYLIERRRICHMPSAGSIATNNAIPMTDRAGAGLAETIEMQFPTPSHCKFTPHSVPRGALERDWLQM